MSEGVDRSRWGETERDKTEMRVVWECDMTIWEKKEGKGLCADPGKRIESDRRDNGGKGKVNVYRDERERDDDDDGMIEWCKGMMYGDDGRVRLFGSVYKGRSDLNFEMNKTQITWNGLMFI